MLMLGQSLYILRVQKKSYFCDVPTAAKKVNEFLFDPETKKLGEAPRTVDESKAMLRSDASYDDLSSTGATVNGTRSGRGRFTLGRPTRTRFLNVIPIVNNKKLA